MPFLNEVNSQVPDIQCTIVYENDIKEFIFLYVKMRNIENFRYYLKVCRKSATKDAHIKP